MLYYGLHWNLHMRVAPSIILSDEQKNELTRLSRSGRTSVRLAERSRIVLLAAEGLQNKEIADRLGIGREQVWPPERTCVNVPRTHLESPMAIVLFAGGRIGGGRRGDGGG